MVAGPSPWAGEGLLGVPTHSSRHPWTFTRCCLHPITLSQSYLGFLGHEAPCLCVSVLGPGQDHLPISHRGGQASAGPDLVLESQVVPRATLPQGLCAVCTAPSPALRGLRHVMA